MSVLVVFVVFCVHMHTLQSPTATLIPLFSSSGLTGCGCPGLLDRKNRSDMCPRWESNPRLPACKASTLSTRLGSPLLSHQVYIRHSIPGSYDRFQITYHNFFNINCVLMRHGFHSLHPLSMSDKYFKRKQMFTHLRRMNM